MKQNATRLDAYKPLDLNAIRLATHHQRVAWMPISLPTNTRNRLVDGIAEGLRASYVVAGAVLQLDGTLWNLYDLVQKGSQADQKLGRYLGDRHVSDFVIHEAQQRRLGRLNDTEPTLGLCEVIGENAPREWAEQLVVSLQSLPWRYTAYVRFPGQLDPALIGPDGLELSETLALVQSNQSPSPPTSSAMASLGSLFGEPGVQQEEAIYIRISFDGYVPRDRDSIGANQILATILSIQGVALSLGIFSLNPWDLVAPGNRHFSIHTYRVSGSQDHYNGNISFDPAHEKEMSKLKQRTGPTPETTTVRTQSLLVTLGKVMDRGGPRLLNAARWFFDSHCGSSDQVRFVQVCIALEILLGDEKQARETGLALLMANRCAYLLGKNNAQREKITSAFKDGYAIRSKIVHAGKSQLSSTEKDHFLYMQGLCAAVIRKECLELEQ